MAVPVGGANNNSAVNVSTLTVNYAPTNGNIVVLFFSRSGAIVNLTVTDNNAVALTPGPSSGGLSCWYYTASGSPTSFTATWITATQCSIAVEEYSGAAGVDGAFFVNTGSSATATQAVLLLAANDFAVCGLSSANTITGSVGNQRQQTTTGTSRLTLMDNTAASITTVSCSGTLTSASWVACGVILGGAGKSRAQQDLEIVVTQPSTSKARIAQDLALAVMQPSSTLARIQQDVIIVVCSNTIFPVVARKRPQLCINS